MGLLAGGGRGAGGRTPGGPLEIGELGPDATSARITTIQDAFAGHVHSPLIFDHNTGYAAFGESTSGPQHSGENVLFLGIADGIERGPVLGGRLAPGGIGRAGEFGHVVVEPDGKTVASGGHGLAEDETALGPPPVPVGGGRPRRRRRSTEAPGSTVG
ncbi:ROK family protein [Kribbella sp. CA-294648]|uniref:ROK family protein n=1 Tax=Kribbella sp. CA-294648 TaxID=3239948 RepID=UPI003D912F9A